MMAQTHRVRQQAGSYGLRPESVLQLAPPRRVARLGTGTMRRITVGAGLLANRLCQPIKMAQTHRIRQQAGSYRIASHGTRCRLWLHVLGTQAVEPILAAGRRSRLAGECGVRQRRVVCHGQAAPFNFTSAPMSQAPGFRAALAWRRRYRPCCLPGAGPSNAAARRSHRCRPVRPMPQPNRP
jgi:hypothetical protein